MVWACHDDNVNAALTFSIVGVAFEVVGLAFAVIGFRRTWVQFRTPGERFLGPVTSALDRATFWLSRVLHHKLPPRTLEIHAASMAMSANSARLSVILPALPSISEDQEGFAKMVQRHLESLKTQNETTAHALQDEIEAAEARYKDTLRIVEHYRTEAHGNVQTVAVGGLRPQVVGWVLVLIGIVLQAIGQVQSGLAA
jgi:hypothetical protein